MLPIYLLIGVSFLKAVSGIYEDQIGLFDWKQSYIGHVSHASYDSLPDAAAGSRSIFVASGETGVFGALSAKDGVVLWRHWLSSGEKISFATLFNDCLLVLSGTNVRCFYPEGILKFQLVLPITGNEVVKLVRSNDDGLIFATEQNICVLRGNNYKCMPIPRQSNAMFFVGCLDNLSVCIITQESSGGVVVFHAAVENGAKLIKLSAGVLDDQITQCDSVSDGQNFLCLLSSGKVLGPVDFKEFSTKQLGYIDRHSCALSGNSGDKAAELKVVAKSMLVTFEDGIKTFCELSGQSRYKINVAVQVVDAAYVEYGGQGAAFTLLDEGNNNFRLVLFDESGAQLADSAFASRELKAENLGALFPIVLKKRVGGGNAPILRCLIRTKYDTLIFVQGGAVKWTRDEGLGQAVSAIFFDLPLPGYLADIASEVVSQTSNIFLSFARRVKFESDILFSTVFDMVDQFSNGGFASLLHFHKDVKHSLLHHHINRHTGDGRDIAVELHRDKFGFEKLIVVLTWPGKVFAIHSLTGVVVWDLLLGDCRPMSILQLRGTEADTRLSSIVAVIGQNVSSNGQMCIVSFDGLTGTIQDTTTYSFLPGVVKSFVYSDPATLITPLLLIVPTHSSVYVYPASLTEFVLLNSKDVYLHLVTEKDNPMVTGYQLAKSKTSNQLLSLSKTWSVVLPVGEHVVNVAERRSDERVYSKAVVLADRTVLYRYLNPNLVFVVTATYSADRKDTDKETLSVYLIDAVSGRLYYQGQHRHARTPVFAVNAENFVTYSYWNSQMRRTEIAVIELFEGKAEKNATTFSSFDNYGTDVPMVLRQGYVLNDNVRSMVITTSRRGITSRSVLLGLASGRILEVPKLLLNPRRLLTMTPEHAEEGIPPYVPEIVMHPESFINYNRSIERISNMYTAASGLESTSLLFVSGLDLYFARVWPSKMFDMLKEDFDYAFIMLITVGLLAATFVFRYLVNLKELKKAWQ